MTCGRCGSRCFVRDGDGDPHCLICGRPPAPVRPPGRWCARCGGPIRYSRRSDAQYCSVRCLSAAATARYKQRHRTPRVYATGACAWCGQPFSVLRSDQRCCSTRCSHRNAIRAYQARRRARRVAA